VTIVRCTLVCHVHLAIIGIAKLSTAMTLVLLAIMVILIVIAPVVILHVLPAVDRERHNAVLATPGTIFLIIPAANRVHQDTTKTIQQIPVQLVILSAQLVLDQNLATAQLVLLGTIWMSLAWDVEHLVQLDIGWIRCITTVLNARLNVQSAQDLQIRSVPPVLSVTFCNLTPLFVAALVLQVFMEEMKITIA